VAHCPLAENRFEPDICNEGSHPKQHLKAIFENGAVVGLERKGMRCNVLRPIVLGCPPKLDMIKLARCLPKESSPSVRERVRSEESFPNRV
jgi:hypothetical protein